MFGHIVFLVSTNNWIRNKLKFIKGFYTFPKILFLITVGFFFKIKKKQTHKYREQTSGYQWVGGRRNVEAEEWEAQTTRC